MKTLFTALAGLFVILSFIAGIGGGIGIFAYGIYLIVLLCKGATAVTFLSVLWPVVCIIGATIGGWIIFFIVMCIAGLLGAIAKACD